jgi:hypothetical protein
MFLVSRSRLGEAFYSSSILFPVERITSAVSQNTRVQQWRSRGEKQIVKQVREHLPNIMGGRAVSKWKSARPSSDTAPDVKIRLPTKRSNVKRVAEEKLNARNWVCGTFV